MKTFTLLAALLFTPVAFADDAAKTTTTTTETSKTTDTSKTAVKLAKLSKSELQVLAHYHALNLMEIDLGKTAVRKSKTADVKAYGQMLIKEHGDSNKKLVSLAKKHGQKIPAEKPMTDIEKQDKADAKAAVMKLKKLKSADFDAAFLSQTVADHEKELAKADTKIAEVQDSELADLIRATKPVLQEHADKARELQKTINTATSSLTGTAPSAARTGSQPKR